MRRSKWLRLLNKVFIYLVLLQIFSSTVGQIDCLGPSRRQRNGGVSKHHSGQQTDFTSQLSKLFLPFSLFPSSRRRSHNHHPARRRSSLHPIRNAASSSKQPSSLRGRQQPQISFPRRKRKNSATATSKFAKKIQTVRHSEVKFSCKNRPPGYYADVNEGCRVYHLCNRHGGGMEFSCPRGTRFQQRTMVCSHKRNVDCQESELFYDTNLRIGQQVNLIDDLGDREKAHIRNNNNVFMQVVIRDSLDENKRVARFPKISSTTPKPFMQLVIDQKEQTKKDRLKFFVSNDETRPGGLTIHDLLVESDPEHSANTRPSRKSHHHPNEINLTEEDQVTDEDDLFPLTTPSSTHTYLTPPSVDADYADYANSSSSPTLNDKFKITPLDAHIWVPVLTPHRGSSTTTSTTSKPTTTTTTSKKEKRKTGLVVSKSSKKQLPSEHPFRRVIPKRARIIGLKRKARPGRRKGARGHHGVMTLGDFLDRYPTMDKVHGAVPVPLDDPEHITMIELLARSDRGPKSTKRQIVKVTPSPEKVDQMIKELDKILANHKHKKAIPIGKFKAKLSNEVPVKPRGSGPSFRFSKSTTVATPTKPIQQATRLIKTPKLEFGFKPITETGSALRATPDPIDSILGLPEISTPQSTATDQTSQSPQEFDSSLLPGFKHSDPFQTDFDDLTSLRFPRLTNGKPTTTSEINSFIRPKPRPDAFFFTTTTAAPVNPDGLESNLINTDGGSDSSGSSSGSSLGLSGLTSLFDMRKFFFIPTTRDSDPSDSAVPSSSTATRRVAIKPKKKRRFFSSFIL